MEQQEKDTLPEKLTVDMVNDEFDSEDSNYYPIMGGRDLENPPDWKGYLDYFIDDVHPHLEALKQYVIDNGLLGSTGQELDGKAFQFSDGTIYGFSWRAWGDFMQAVVGEREGYMAYYM